MTLSLPAAAVACALTQAAGRAPVPLSIIWDSNVQQDGWYTIDGKGEQHWVTDFTDEPFPVGQNVNSALIYETPPPRLSGVPAPGQQPLSSYKDVAQLFIEYMHRLFGVVGQRLILNEERWQTTWARLATTRTGTATALSAVGTRVQSLYQQASTAAANLGAAVGAVRENAGMQAQQICATHTATTALQGSVATAQSDAAAARTTAEITSRNTENVAANLLEEEKRAHDREEALHRMVEASTVRTASDTQALAEQIAALAKALEERFTASGSAMAEVREQQRRLFANQKKDKRF